MSTEQEERIGDRLAAIMAHYGQTAYQMAGQMGYDRPNRLYNLVRHEVKPSYETLIDLLRAYPEVQAEWLLRGTGPMLFEAAATESVPAPTVFVGNEAAGMVVVPVGAQGDYWRRQAEVGGLNGYETMRMPGYDAAVHRGFEMDGNRMEPTVGHRDVVVASRVSRWDLVLPQHVYVVVMSRDLAVARLVGPVRKGMPVGLHLDNRAYPAYEVPYEEVKELWLGRALWTTSIPAEPHEGRQQLLKLLEGLTKDSGQLRQVLADTAKRPGLDKGASKGR